MCRHSILRFVFLACKVYLFIWARLFFFRGLHRKASLCTFFNNIFKPARSVSFPVARTWSRQKAEKSLLVCKFCSDTKSVKSYYTKSIVGFLTLHSSIFFSPLSFVYRKRIFFQIIASCLLKCWPFFITEYMEDPPSNVYRFDVHYFQGM